MKILFAEADLNLISEKYRGKEKEKKKIKVRLRRRLGMQSEGRPTWPAKVEYRVEFIGIPEGMSWIRASEI